MADLALQVPLFVVPDAYTFVPGSVLDTSEASIQGSGKITELSVEILATLFGATCKLQGSNDKVNWVDLVTSTGAGVANTADVVVVVNVAQVLTLGPLVSGAAGLELRYYRLMAKNTVGASVANVIASYFAE